MKLHPFLVYIGITDLFVGLGSIDSKRHEEIWFSDYFFSVDICVCIGSDKT